MPSTLEEIIFSAFEDESLNILRTRLQLKLHFGMISACFSSNLVPNPERLFADAVCCTSKTTAFLSNSMSKHQ